MSGASKLNLRFSCAAAATTTVMVGLLPRIIETTIIAAEHCCCCCCSVNSAARASVISERVLQRVLKVQHRKTTIAITCCSLQQKLVLGCVAEEFIATVESSLCSSVGDAACQLEREICANGSRSSIAGVADGPSCSSWVESDEIKGVID